MKGKSSYIVITAISLVVFLLGELGFLKPFINASDYVLTPLRIGVEQVRSDLTNFTSSIANSGKLKEENVNLRLKIIEIENEVNILNTNKTTCEDKITPPEDQYKTSFSVESYVLSKNYMNLQGIMLVNKGESAEVRENDIVIFDKYYVGRVTKVNKFSAVINTYHSTTNLGEGIIIDRGVTGIIVLNNGRLELTKILTSEKVEKGDIAYIHINDFYTPIPIGKISEIITTNGSPEKSAVIEPFVKPTEITSLTIIRK